MLVDWPVLGEHFLALLLVWGWVALTGLALLPWLRCRVGLAGAPLLGVIYWAIALYVFPFAGGLDIAAGCMIVLAMVNLLRVVALRKEPAAQARESLACAAGSKSWKKWSWASVILLAGSLPYLTTLLSHYVPYGMDATMHTTAAVLIAQSRGLPATYAPFSPDVTFPAVNLGLPAVAAVAIRCGGDPAAVMLASHHLTFTALILASYVLLRWWTTRIPAAVLAVVSVWLARSSQATINWGGFPTVLSIAIGLLAARLLLQQARINTWRLSLTTGAAIAAIPLIHGIGGGTWIYCVGVWTVFATILMARSRRATLAGLAISGLFAAALLLVYRCSGTLDVQRHEMDLTREFVQANAPEETGLDAWWAALLKVRKESGSVIVAAGLFAWLALAVRRQWSALLLAGAALTLPTLVANARWYVLPGSFLLYPERVLYWTAPLCAVAMAMAWRLAPITWRHSRWAVALAIGSLVVSACFHNQFYQKAVREDYLDRDGWEGLVWARQNLHPQTDFVSARYNSAGSYLPALALVGSSGAHQHHFVLRQARQANARRVYTHQFLENNNANDANLPHVGKVVFRNRSVTILELMPILPVGHQQQLN